MAVPGFPCLLFNNSFNCLLAIQIVRIELKESPPPVDFGKVHPKLSVNRNPIRLAHAVFYIFDVIFHIILSHPFMYSRRFLKLVSVGNFLFMIHFFFLCSWATFRLHLS